jgi:hypothetical protein
MDLRQFGRIRSVKDSQNLSATGNYSEKKEVGDVSLLTQ